MELETLRMVARLGAVTFGAPALFCALWWGLRFVRRGERRYCPGPARSALVRCFPPAWFFRRPCGYDLRGLPLGSACDVTCPECGRRVDPARAGLRGVWRWRPGRAAAVLALVAMVCWVPVVLKTTSWQRRVPTTALIVTKRVLGPSATPFRLRRELDRRLERGGLWGWQVEMVLPALAMDLRDDGVTRNAERAADHLAELGDRGKARLEACLRSENRQERWIAAETLRGQLIAREEDDAGYSRVVGVVGEPSDDLLRVTLEQLDMRPAWDMDVRHAWDEYVFLGMFRERVTPMLGERLRSTDRRTALLTAGLVVLMKEGSLEKEAVGVLIDRLRGNSERGDAEYAARALYTMGPAGEAYLEPYLYAAEAQQRELARLVFQNLRKAPKHAGEFPDEGRLWNLTYPGYVERREAGKP